MLFLIAHASCRRAFGDTTIWYERESFLAIDPCRKEAVDTCLAGPLVTFAHTSRDDEKVAAAGPDNADASLQFRYVTPL